MKTDQQFLRALENSRACVNAVAQWLVDLGYDVAVKPSPVRPDASVRHEYADSGDLELRMRVEVKHRSVPFTDRDSYPFQTVIVDETYKVDRLDRRSLYAYVIVNEARTHAAVIKADTISQWTIMSTYDSKEGESRRFYVCDVSLAQFYNMGSN